MRKYYIINSNNNRNLSKKNKNKKILHSSQNTLSLWINKVISFLELSKKIYKN